MHPVAGCGKNHPLDKGRCGPRLDVLLGRVGPRWWCSARSGQWPAGALPSSMVVLGLILRAALGAVTIVAVPFRAPSRTARHRHQPCSSSASAPVSRSCGASASQVGDQAHLRQRRASKKLNELSEQLERREAEQRDARRRDRSI